MDRFCLILRMSEMRDAFVFMIFLGLSTAFLSPLKAMEEVKNMPCQYIPLWKGYFNLKAFESEKMQDSSDLPSGY